MFGHRQPIIDITIEVCVGCRARAYDVGATLRGPEWKAKTCIQKGGAYGSQAAEHIEPRRRSLLSSLDAPCADECSLLMKLGNNCRS